MEAAIQTVVKTFLKSAKGGDSMGGKDFDNLVKKQLGNVLSDTDSKAALKEMRTGLDENQDGKVSFDEYMSLIGYLANSMSEAKIKAKEEPAAAAAAAPATNSAPAAENNKAAAPAVVVAAPAVVVPSVELPKVEVKKVEVALPDATAAVSAVSAAAAAAGVTVVGAEPKENVVEVELASGVADLVVNSGEEATS